MPELEPVQPIEIWDKLEGWETEEEEAQPVLGIMISGSGTNLQAVIDACASGALDARIGVVISNKVDAYGLERARNAGIPTAFIDPGKHGDIRKYNKAILETLLEYEVDLVVMAGYMRLLGKEVLHAYPRRVINLHPALLPSFPGASAIRDAFDYGVKITGVTVHFADEEFDRGPIIVQEPIRIEERDTLQTLETKIHEVEHVLLPQAIDLVISDRLSFDGRIVHIAE